MNYKIDTTEKRTSDLENKSGYFFSPEDRAKSQRKK